MTTRLLLLLTFAAAISGCMSSDESNECLPVEHEQACRAPDDLTDADFSLDESSLDDLGKPMRVPHASYDCSYHVTLRGEPNVSDYPDGGLIEVEGIGGPNGFEQRYPATRTLQVQKNESCPAGERAQQLLAGQLGASLVSIDSTGVYVARYADECCYDITTSPVI
jgi:hypothetical protein